MVRWGTRHYHTALRVGDDIAKRTDEGYWTSSLWRYIGEYISHNGNAGVKQKKRPDYNYLAKLFEKNINGKTSVNKELTWLDLFLKSNESGVGMGLGYTYPKFITTFAHYVPARENSGKAKNWQKCLFTNFNCRKGNVKTAAEACTKVDLSETQTEFVTKAIKFSKVSARCFKVFYTGPANKIDIQVFVESNNKKIIN